MMKKPENSAPRKTNLMSFLTSVPVLILLMFLAVSETLFCQIRNATGEIQVNPDGITGFQSNGYSQLKSGMQLKYPWAGGLNSCQFCPIDLNLDGIMDLLIFDRHGNRKLTLINHGTPNTVDYTYAPEYAEKMPEMHDWIMTADYDCDGKIDLFTYGMGGIRVFKNISDTVLTFKLVTNLLESFYYNGYVGILVTSVDYPAIADIDDDGDLDILTFFGLGSFVEYHKNLSVEKYGNCDSLDFRLTDPCWGKFKESEDGNQIVLNVDCPYTIDDLRFTIYDLRKAAGEVEIVNRNDRHTGSTMLAMDLNNDGLKDLIVGDVDYPGLTALYNGGTRDSALMISQDREFPEPSRPVHLFSFPAIFCLDIDNDGRKDLLISPFDPALYTSENYNCVWFYKNTGTNALPEYELQTDHLFRDEMMDFGSASHPVFYDFDGDGLQDLFVGNDGMYDSSNYFQATLRSYYTAEVQYFKNTGTTVAPEFTFITENLAGISDMGLRGAYPALGDLTGDGLPDLILGNSDGTIIFFKNTGGSAWVPEFEAPVKFWHGIDVGAYSVPQLFDLDKDNLPDLIIGEQNGNLNYYKNTGTTSNPSFVLVTDSLGKVNVTNFNLSYYGYSTPCFFRKPGGATFLTCGSDEGRIHLYENIDNNLDGNFTASDTLYNWLSATPTDSLFGWQTSPAIAHLSDQVEFDLVTGNFSGGLNYITKRTPAVIIPGISDKPEQPVSRLVLFPNPTDQSVTINAGAINEHATGTDHSGNNFPNLQVFNLFGQKILEIPFAGCSILPTATLPDGIYVVRCGSAVAKLIVRHP